APSVAASSCSQQVPSWRKACSCCWHAAPVSDPSCQQPAWSMPVLSALSSLSLFGGRLRGLGLFRLLVGVFVMAPERDFCEAAMVLLVLTFFGISVSLGHRQRAEQHQADHKAQGSSDCFTHEASRFRELCSGSWGL